jgi:hypothetical protein
VKYTIISVSTKITENLVNFDQISLKFISSVEMIRRDLVVVGGVEQGPSDLCRPVHHLLWRGTGRVVDVPSNSLHCTCVPDADGVRLPFGRTYARICLSLSRIDPSF